MARGRRECDSFDELVSFEAGRVRFLRRASRGWLRSLCDHPGSGRTAVPNEGYLLFTESANVALPYFSRPLLRVRVSVAPPRVPGLYGRAQLRRGCDAASDASSLNAA